MTAPQEGPRAPGVRRIVVDGDTWPPPTTPEDIYVEVQIIVDGDRRANVTGRRVRLWGQSVVIDESGAAFCDGCRAFVPLAELAAADNSHRVGLPAISHALLPMGYGQ